MVGASSPGPTTLYSEGLTGALFLDKPREVARFIDVWESLEEITLDRDSSDDLLATIIKESDG